MTVHHVRSFFARAAAVLAVAALASPSLAQTRATALPDVDTRQGQTVDLPVALKEISGLATTADGRFLSHDDELGIVYEIDVEQGRIVKAFRLGNRPARADFEGIAVVDDRVFLVTSEGVLYSSPEGADGEAVRYEMLATGVGRTCEVEGLAFEPSDRTLLLPCKRMHDRAREDSVFIFRWSVDRRELARPSQIVIPRHRLTAGLDGPDFRPTSIERHPVTGTYFLLSTNERAIAELTPSGEVLAVRALARSQHRQPEGIAFTRDLVLVVSDEGKVHGQLTLYRRAARAE